MQKARCGDGVPHFQQGGQLVGGPYQFFYIGLQYAGVHLNIAAHASQCTVHIHGVSSWKRRRRYGVPVPATMSEDDRTVAASLVTLLKGDAGQRAVIAQAFGWAPAQRASGTNWMAPYLGLFLNDSYDAVRYITGRSLRTLPGFTDFPFDFVAPSEQREAARRRALGLWRDSRDRIGRRGDPELLFNPDGSFVADRIDRLTNQRDRRRIFYRE